MSVTESDISVSNMLGGKVGVGSLVKQDAKVNEIQIACRALLTVGVASTREIGIA